MKTASKTFQSYLRSHKLKMTRTRALVFDEIMASPVVHPNAYQIHQRLKEKGKKVSLATIYRTLNLLVKTGLVSTIDLGESHSHYEPKITKSAHGHLICLSCGKLQEFSHGRIQPLLNKVSGDNKFLLDTYSIQVFGYCQNCRKTGKEKS